MKKILLILVFIPLFGVSQTLDRFARFTAENFIYDEQDAADPNNESNTVGTNWSAQGGDPISIASSATQADDGTYSLHLTVDSTHSLPEMGLVLVNVNNGDDVTITGRIYEVSGNWSIRAETADGWTSQVTDSGFAQDTWETFTLSNVVANQDDPIILFRGPSGSTASTNTYIDNIVITLN